MFKHAVLSPQDVTMIQHYLMGGAALGGGAALVTSLLNHLKDSQRASDFDKDEDNNALHLTLRQRKPVQKIASLRSGLAMAGGGLAAAGAYALVRSLYQKYKEREAQKELEQAEHGYIDVLDPSTAAKHAMAGVPSILLLARKMASVPGKAMSTGEHLAGLPALGLILTALATGAISYHALKKQFPETKPAARLGPKRVVIDRKTVESPDDEEQPADATISASKLASARQLLLRNVHMISPRSQTADLINAVAGGRFSELEQLVKVAGVAAVYDAVKNAAPADYAASRAACKQIAHHPFFSEISAVMAAGDFANASPTYFRKAASCDPSEIQLGVLVGAEILESLEGS